jgi:hemerythrin
MPKEIEIFPWNDNFATGITIIDEQHKHLVELLNILVGHLAFQSEAPAVEDVLGELQEYAQEHYCPVKS